MVYVAIGTISIVANSPNWKCPRWPGRNHEDTPVEGWWHGANGHGSIGFGSGSSIQIPCRYGRGYATEKKIVETFLGETHPSFLETVPSASSELPGAVIICPTCSNITPVN